MVRPDGAVGAPRILQLGEASQQNVSGDGAKRGQGKQYPPVRIEDGLDRIALDERRTGRQTGHYVVMPQALENAVESKVAHPPEAHDHKTSDDAD